MSARASGSLCRWMDGRTDKRATGGWMDCLLAGWLVGCLGLNGPLRQYFGLYRVVSQRGEKEKRGDK